MRPGAPIHFRLIAQALQYRGALALSVFVLFGASVLTVATPALIGYAVDTGLAITSVTKDGVSSQVAEGNVRTLVWASVLVMIAAGFRGAFVYGQTYLSEAISQRIAYDFRNMLYDRLQRLSYAYHDKAEVGEIMSRATADVEGVRLFVSLGVIRALYVIVLISISYGLMLATNLKVGLIAVAFVPAIGLQASITAIRLRPVWLRVQEVQGELATVLQENLTGQRVVKAFSRARYEQEKFDRKVEELFVHSYGTAKFQAFNEPFMVALWLLSTAVVFWTGTIEIQHGRMTVGDLVAFQIYLSLLQVPVRAIGFIVNITARSHSSGARLFEILDAVSPVQDAEGAQPLRPGPGEVVFENVSFGYDPARPVIRGVNIVAKPGETIALLGPTGSGKSTIVNLLPRFYDVTAGRILIDGQDVRDVTAESLRADIGIVQQDVFLFASTIRENIAYGRSGATDQEIEDAAKAARLHDFIMSQPDGYETWVGERGATLSGGQRQRTAIARTLLMDPRILVFDDSTAAVDMRTEHQIQEALRELMRGRTTFVIAQRLRTVKEADQVLVMRNGEIVERGRHEELLALNGFYRQIYDLELRDQEEAAAAETEAEAVRVAEAGGA